MPLSFVQLLYLVGLLFLSLKEYNLLQPVFEFDCKICCGLWDNSRCEIEDGKVIVPVDVPFSLVPAHRKEFGMVLCVRLSPRGSYLSITHRERPRWLAT